MMQTDERLTVDTPIMRIPLDEVSFHTPSVAATCTADDDSIISSLSDDEDPLHDDQEHQQQIVDSVPRSIFSSYWKVDPKTRTDCAAEARTSTEFESSPQQQRRRKILMNTTSPDPYKYFGISTSNSTSTSRCPLEEEKVAEEEDYSVNTYERMLRQYEQQQHLHHAQVMASSSTKSSFESRPLWMSFFGGSCYSSEPQLSSSWQHGKASRTRLAQSDTALIKTPKKSCLRRGRFSSSSCGEQENSVHYQQRQCRNSASAKVCFQPKIQVHVFQPPVEKWAPTGWSDWFG